ncbi:MAG: hypothetical protein CR217_10075 [Beijerinckiaceae bacterium]|nr:MAG: hypothetical protein CR217_10075 [Beijerinckiaceae bacterium]
MRSDPKNPALFADTASEAKKYPRRESGRYIGAGIIKHNANDAATGEKLRGRAAVKPDRSLTASIRRRHCGFQRPVRIRTEICGLGQASEGSFA